MNSTIFINKPSNFLEVRFLVALKNLFKLFPFSLLMKYIHLGGEYESMLFFARH